MANRSTHLDLNSILSDLDSISSNPSLLPPATTKGSAPDSTTSLTNLSETSGDLTRQQAQELASKFLALSDEVLQKAGSGGVETVGEGLDRVEKRALEYQGGLKGAKGSA